MYYLVHICDFGTSRVEYLHACVLTPSDIEPTCMTNTIFGRRNRRECEHAYMARVRLGLMGKPNRGILWVYNLTFNNDFDHVPDI